MRYAELLSKAVKESGWSYTEIARRCQRHGITINRTYLCKLCTGNKPPASDGINRALATVLSPVADINYEKLKIAAYKDPIPQEILEAIVNEVISEREQMNGSGQLNESAEH